MRNLVRIRGWAVVLAWLVTSPYTYAQTTLTGTVTDSEDGGVLPGVNVVIKGTTVGTVTNVEGSYSLTAPDDATTLVFSSVGYIVQEVDIGNQTTVSVSLEPDVQSLTEVVVVGYGTQDSRDVTAAIASVDSKDIERIPVASSVQAIQGQVAGVDVLSGGGRPGQAPSIRIRGRRSITASNDPLYVIDGVPQTSSTAAIFDISANDIASMEILKDAASTAIYGSRGANGVVLITTKRGTPGEFEVTYDGYYGISTVANQVDMMNGPEFAQLKRESRRQDADGAAAWNGTIPADEVVFDDPTELESIANGRSTNYQDLVLDNGWQTNHALSVRGGSERTQFNVSLGYFNEQGIISVMDYQRINGRINLDHRISKVFKVGMSTLLSFSTQNYGNNNIMGEALANNPLGNPYEEDGSLRFLPTNDGIRTNPLNELAEGAFIDERKVTRIFAPLYLDAKITEGLQYRMVFGPDIRYNRRGFFAASLTNTNRGGPADAAIFNNEDFGYTFENLLLWEKTLGGIHDIKLTALQSIQALRFEGQFADVSNLPYETQLFYNIGTGEQINGVFSRLQEWKLASYMGRINYELKDRYLFQASLRADGSSRLGAGNKWQYFPGVSVGWRLSDEPFLVNTGLAELKLRGSYGSVGNTSVRPYQTFGRLSRTVYAWDEAPAFGYALDEIPNPTLGWEISSTVDVGVDFGFFGGRLTGSVDWFQTNTTDLLLNRNLPETSGYPNILQNTGATQSEGIELGLKANVAGGPGRDFYWNVSLNAARFTEEITELALKDANGNSLDDVGNEWFIGQPIKVFFDYEKEGIYQANEVDLADSREQKVPGEIKLKDQDGDGVITPDDRVIIGTDLPDILGGITNEFGYKGFSFSFFFYYRLGHTVQSLFHSSNNSLFARYNNLDVDYWTIDNPTNANPRPNQNQEFPRNGTTLTYFDGSFVKLRNVTLGYDFGEDFAQRLGMNSLRVYVSAQNPIFWSKYDTFDPEISDPDNSDSNGNDIAQIGSGVVPANRMFLVGIRANLNTKQQ